MYKFNQRKYILCSDYDSNTRLFSFKQFVEYCKTNTDAFEREILISEIGDHTEFTYAVEVDRNMRMELYKELGLIKEDGQ